MADVTKVGFVSLYPFCSNKFEEVAGQCVGCSYILDAGLAILNDSGHLMFTDKSLCNPNVTEYPLPLYKCSICKQGLLNTVLGYIIFISLLSVLSNTWSIIVWLKQSEKSPQIIFKISLAVSDVIFGFVVLPLTAVNMIILFFMPQESYYSFYILTSKGSKEYEDNWENLFITDFNIFIALVLYISQATSLCNILLLNIDRHLAIVYNIKYYQIMTKKKTLFLVLGMWIIFIVIGFVATFICKPFVVSPFALFLPIVLIGNSKQDNEMMVKVLTVYVLTLGLLFFASCIVALTTSLKLYKLSINNYTSQLSQISTSSSKFFNYRSSINQIFPKHLKLQKIDNHPGIIYDNNVIQEEVKLDLNSLKNCNSMNKETTTSQQNQQAGPIHKNEDVLKVKTFQELIVMKNDAVTNQQQTKKSKRCIFSERSSISSRINEYKHASRTLLMILVSYALCVLPLTSCLIIFISSETYFLEPEYRDPISIGFSASVTIFLLLPIRNIFIFCIRNRQYRANSRKVLKKIRMFCDF